MIVSIAIYYIPLVPINQAHAPLMGQQMPYISERPAFNITPPIAEKLKTISPATIDRRLKKDREALRLKGKSLTKPLGSLKSRIPIRTFSTTEERKYPAFGKSTQSTTAVSPLLVNMSIP
jgi:hypothetical protein